MSLVPKRSINYECKTCDYNTNRMSQYERHLLTAKHENRTFRTKKVYHIVNLMTEKMFLERQC